MARTERRARWRDAATILVGAVLAFAVVSIVLDGQSTARAAGDCEYGQYGQYGQCEAATPTLTTTPQPAGAQLGWWVYDRATLSGGNNPTGTLTFSLYAPADQTCANAVFVSQTGVGGNGDYYSGSYPVDRPGTWRWTVSYSGDGQNGAVSSGCSDELVTVTKAIPSAYLSGPGAVTVGSTSWAYLSASGAYQATGSVTVGFYRPGDPSCTGQPAWQQDFSWYGSSYANGWMYSGPIDEFGTWRYKVDYAGDANNESISLPCGTVSFQVYKASPYVWSAVSPGAITIGADVTVNGQVAYGYQPTGTVAVSFFAPNDPGCSVPAGTRNTALRADGTFDIAFTPTSVGTWRTTASYSGDELNNPASTWCGSASVEVAKASPSLAPAANPTTAQTGTRLQALTLVQGGYRAAGRVAFRLYRPDDPTCAGLPAYIEEASVRGGAASTSTGYLVPSEGTWRWQAVYLGDDNNNGSTSGCDQAPVAVVAKLGTPPKSTGGTPFVTNVYFNCADDHNIGVPYGSRLVLRTGWATKTEKQLKAFLSGNVTRVVVDGLPVGNADQLWAKPVLGSGDAPWSSRWEYDTGRVITAFTQPFTVELQIVATKAGTDGFGTYNSGDILVSTGGPCLVAGYQP